MILCKKKKSFILKLGIVFLPVTSTYFFYENKQKKEKNKIKRKGKEKNKIKRKGKEKK